MLNFHFFLSHKGGIGKSWSCVQLATYLQDYLGKKVFCFDTDQQNATLGKYKNAFPVKIFNLIDEDTKTINTRFYDKLIEEELPNLPKGTEHILIDVGSNSYLSLISYMNENALLPMLQSLGNVYVHASINGGQAYTETIDCLQELSQFFNSATLIIWENQHLAGKVQNSQGVHFLQDSLYQDAIKNINSYVISIPFLNKDTYGRDLEALSAKNITITQAQSDERYAASIMVKQRLLNFQRLMFTELANVEFIKEVEHE